MPITELDGFAIRCPDCGADSRNFDKIYICHLWANGAGRKFRLFCHLCGSVYDVTIRHGESKAVKLTMKAAIWRENVSW
jgi:rubredoxin